MRHSQTYTVSQPMSMVDDALTEAEARQIYSAVLLRMLRDAVSEHKDSCSQKAKRKARQWLSRPHDDFRMVCWFADLDPDVVYPKVQAILADGGFQFRVGGKGQHLQFLQPTVHRKKGAPVCN